MLNRKPNYVYTCLYCYKLGHLEIYCFIKIKYLRCQIDWNQMTYATLNLLTIKDPKIFGYQRSKSQIVLQICLRGQT